MSRFLRIGSRFININRIVVVNLDTRYVTIETGQIAGMWGLGTGDLGTTKETLYYPKDLHESRRGEWFNQYFKDNSFSFGEFYPE